MNFQPHIIWDWNGTLLDDTEAALATLNIMIAERGGTPIGMPFYLDNFAFPVRPFYDRIGIVAHGEDEWNAIAREYHETYLRQPKALNRGAFAALDMAKAAGCRQSILSALRQDLLDEQTREYGIGSRIPRRAARERRGGGVRHDRRRGARQGGRGRDWGSVRPVLRREPCGLAAEGDRAYGGHPLRRRGDGPWPRPSD